MENESELLNAARGMDKQALVQIFDRYAEPLYRYALRLCGDVVLADHVVGDVFARLLDQFAAGRGPQAALRSYLYEATYHRIIDESRAARRKAPLEITEWLPQTRQEGSGSLEDHVLLKQTLQAIQHKLTEDQRNVIVLRFMEGFNLRETAAILGKKEEHVKVLQSRGMSKLRKVLTSPPSGPSLPRPTPDNPSSSIGV